MFNQPHLQDIIDRKGEEEEEEEKEEEEEEGKMRKLFGKSVVSKEGGGFLLPKVRTMISSTTYEIL